MTLEELIKIYIPGKYSEGAFAELRELREAKANFDLIRSGKVYPCKYNPGTWHWYCPDSDCMTLDEALAAARKETKS